MPTYRFLIHGTNVLLEPEPGDLVIGGFWCQIVAAGKTLEDAKIRAAAELTQDASYLENVENKRGDEPTLDFDEVELLPHNVNPPDYESGIIFYAEERKGHEGT